MSETTNESKPLVERLHEAELERLIGDLGEKVKQAEAEKEQLQRRIAEWQALGAETPHALEVVLDLLRDVFARGKEQCEGLQVQVSQLTQERGELKLCLDGVDISAFRAQQREVETLRTALEPLIPFVEAYRVSDASNDKLYELIGGLLEHARAALASTSPDSVSKESLPTQSNQRGNPDTEDVPWFDKRKGLAAYAYFAGGQTAIDNLAREGAPVAERPEENT